MFAACVRREGLLQKNINSFTASRWEFQRNYNLERHDKQIMNKPTELLFLGTEFHYVKQGIKVSIRRGSNDLF